MKRSFHLFLSVSLTVLLVGVPAASQDNAADLDIRDRELFPVEIFPELDDLTEAELLLQGLHSLFPERIFQGTPDEEESAERRAPLVKTIGNGVAYLRAYHLEESLSAVRENLTQPVLILDLRYTASDLPSTVALGSLLTRRPEFHLYGAGDYPLPDDAENGRITVRSENLRNSGQTLITLSNWETSGPVEVLLEQLKRDAEIISIGTKTAGHTASFRRLPSHPEWRVVSGELRPDPDVSLVDNGFSPRVEVDLEPEHDLASYRRLTEETEIDAVVQTEVRRSPARSPMRRSPAPNDEETSPEETPPPDLILQRAINIVKALQALGEIPR